MPSIPTADVSQWPRKKMNANRPSDCLLQVCYGRAFAANNGYGKIARREKRPSQRIIILCCTQRWSILQWISHRLKKAQCISKITLSHDTIRWRQHWLNFFVVHASHTRTLLRSQSPILFKSDTIIKMRKLLMNSEKSGCVVEICLRWRTIIISFLKKGRWKFSHILSDCLMQTLFTQYHVRERWRVKWWNCSIFRVARNEMKWNCNTEIFGITGPSTLTVRCAFAYQSSYKDSCTILSHICSKLFFLLFRIIHTFIHPFNFDAFPFPFLFFCVILFPYPFRNAPKNLCFQRT